MLVGGGGWLARHSTIKEMGPPHRLDVWAWTQSSVRWGGGGVASFTPHHQGDAVGCGVWGGGGVVGMATCIKWGRFRRGVFGS